MTQCFVAYHHVRNGILLVTALTIAAIRVAPLTLAMIRAEVRRPSRSSAMSARGVGNASSAK